MRLNIGLRDSPPCPQGVLESTARGFLFYLFITELWAVLTSKGLPDSEQFLIYVVRLGSQLHDRSFEAAKVTWEVLNEASCSNPINHLSPQKWTGTQRDQNKTRRIG